MNILTTQNLTHTFPNGFTAINDINLAIQAGEFIIIAGTNGSGKTVLMQHFNGLLLPTEGRVLVEGEPVTKDLTSARKKIGLIFQNSDNQIVGQTVAEDVAFGPENLRLPRAEVASRVKEALDAVDLSELANQPPHTLSGGQKRKLAIAGVLAMKPQVIVFDEPFTGLDYPGVLQVLKQIVTLHQKGHTLILVTHDLDKVLAHAGRLIIMEKGRIVKDGHPNDLIEKVEAYGIHKPFGENRSITTMTWLS
ncbi:MAG TPA: ABC transporter ATP-binding protein [Firmicutes bacterium]|jgi:biotin transport system ATP-binding protein|nr:ABC transporter ATP-binding protein [Bacillota bacterium]